MHGWVYMLWAEGTSRFKIGYTGRTVDARAADIMAYSPLALRIVAERPGTPRQERAMHTALRKFRVHGEWFDLPEPAVWHALRWFGIVPPPGAVLN